MKRVKENRDPARGRGRRRSGDVLKGGSIERVDQSLVERFAGGENVDEFDLVLELLGAATTTPDHRDRITRFAEERSNKAAAEAVAVNLRLIVPIRRASSVADSDDAVADHSAIADLKMDQVSHFRSLRAV